MKKILLFGLSCVLLLGMASAFAGFWGTKVAVFDLNEVLKSDQQVTVEQDKLKQQFLPDGQKIVNAKKTLQNDLKNYNAMQDKGNAEAKKLGDKINQEGNSLVSMQNDFQNRLVIAQQAALKRVLDQVKVAANKVAKDKGYDLVFTNNNVAYNSSKIDITKDIIATMKKSSK